MIIYDVLFNIELNDQLKTRTYYNNGKNSVDTYSDAVHYSITNHIHILMCFFPLLPRTMLDIYNTGFHKALIKFIHKLSTLNGGGGGGEGEVEN